MKTFVTIGQRVPINNGAKFEGYAKVKTIHQQSDQEAAFIEVQFEGDPDGETYDRWIWPHELSATT